MSTNTLLAMLALLVVLGVACAQTGVAPRPADPAPAGPDGPPVTTRIAYGDDRSQWVDVTVPATPGPHPTIALIHGGFWYDGFGADLMDALVQDVSNRGWAVANLEYRRVNGGGGFPQTFEDVAAALDALADVEGLDASRVAVAGHSAGGHLALWAGLRGLLEPDAPGASPQLRPCAVVGQAAVADLAGAAGQGLGGGAVQGLLGGDPDQVPLAYAVADPSALGVDGVPILLVHGTRDGIVPFQQSEAYAEHVRAAGGAVTVQPFDGGHFDVLDPGTENWQATMAWISLTCGFGTSG